MVHCGPARGGSGDCHSVCTRATQATPSFGRLLSRETLARCLSISVETLRLWSRTTPAGPQAPNYAFKTKTRLERKHAKNETVASRIAVRVGSGDSRSGVPEARNRPSFPGFTAGAGQVQPGFHHRLPEDEPPRRCGSLGRRRRGSASWHGAYGR